MVETFTQELDRVRRLIPAAYHLHTYIAGGAAIVPALATDIDIYIFTPFDYTATKLHYDLLRLAAARDGEWMRVKEAEKDSGAPAVLPPYMQKVGDFRPRNVIRGRGIQLFLVNTAEVNTVERLLADFDISTHMWALHLASGNQFRGTLATLPSVPPRAAGPIRVPEWTLERLEKLSERYGFDVSENEDWKKLNDRIAQEQD